jgi:tungstate transport system substrate-binding protein
MTTRRLSLSLAAAPFAGPSGLERGGTATVAARPFRLAVDDAIADSASPPAAAGFGRDTGVAVEVLHGPASSVLQALERGEHDAAITNAPAVEQPLEKEGLVHDRQLVAHSEFVLVGPSVLAKPLAAGKDVVLGDGAPGAGAGAVPVRATTAPARTWPSRRWRAARSRRRAVVPRGTPAARVLAQARQQKACVLVERGVWAPSRRAATSRCWPAATAAGGEVHVMRTLPRARSTRSASCSPHGSPGRRAAPSSRRTAATPREPCRPRA